MANDTSTLSVSKRNSLSHPEKKQKKTWNSSYLPSKYTPKICKSYLYIYICISIHVLTTLCMYICVYLYIYVDVYTRAYTFCCQIVACACVYMTHICKRIRKRIEGRPEKKMKKENTKSSKTSTSHRFKSVLWPIMHHTISSPRSF